MSRRWLKLSWVGWGAGCLLLGLAALVQAQSNEAMRLYLHGQPEVDKSGPQVKARLTVLGPEGLPLTGLATDNFLIFEADQPPKPPLVVQEEVDQALRLVLAVDLSMHYLADLSVVKAAAYSLIDHLGPQDHLTIRTFYNQLGQVLFAGYVTNPDDLKVMINDQIVTGDRTTLYQIADWGIQTLNRTDSATQGRQAVIILTNMNNNIDTPAGEQARQQVERGERPVHILSFGDRADQAQLQRLAQATQGRHLHAPRGERMTGEMIDNLEELIGQLRPSYTITFLPRPGQEPHREFTIQASNPGIGIGTAQGSYELERGNGQVTLHGAQNISLGQRFDIMAAVTSTYPVESVTFEVSNGQRLTDDAAPYTYPFLGANSGVYTITATAIDRLGFTIPAASTSVEVRSGIDVFGVIEAVLGDTVRFEVLVDKPAEVSRVELLQGSEVITSTDSSPYYLTLQPGAGDDYPSQPGYHEFKARVINENGSTDEARIMVRFAEPRPALGRGPELPSMILMSIGHLLLPLVLIWWWINWNAERNRRLRPLRLFLRNVGNAWFAFRLDIITTNPRESLEFQIDHVDPPPLRPEFEGKEAKKTAPISDQSAEPVSTNDKARPDRTRAEGDQSQISPNINQQGQQVLGKMGGVAGWVLKGLDFFSRLPLVGGSFRNVAHHLRQWQIQARSTTTQPKWITDLVKRFFRPVETAGEPPESKRPPSQTEDPSAPTNGRHAPSPTVSQSVQTQPPKVGSKRRPPHGKWDAKLDDVRTGPVEPGQAAEVKLRVRPTQFSSRTRCYTVQVCSIPIDLIFKSDQADEETKEISLTIEGLSWFYRNLGWLTIATLLAVVLIDLFWLWILFQF